MSFIIIHVRWKHVLVIVNYVVHGQNIRRENVHELDHAHVHAHLLRQLIINNVVHVVIISIARNTMKNSNQSMRKSNGSVVNWMLVHYRNVIDQRKPSIATVDHSLHLFNDVRHTNNIMMHLSHVAVPVHVLVVALRTGDSSHLMKIVSVNFFSPSELHH